jgi:hypothetical protein
MNAVQVKRSEVIAFTNHRLECLASNPKAGDVGWAHYPKHTFGHWKPANKKARESMLRPKRVTYHSGVGWVFDIEARMTESASSARPTGFVYQTEQGATPPSYVEGVVAFLQTKVGKRVKVVLSSEA